MKTSNHKKCKTKKKLIQYNNTKYKHNNKTYKIKRVHIGGSGISLHAIIAQAQHKEAQITQIITIITNHILSLIDNNTNYLGDNKITKFNKTVNYLFDLFNLSKKIPEALIKEEDIGRNAEDFLINLISINYKAYIKNKKNLLELQKTQQQQQFISVHGTLESDTNKIIFFKLPSNITIIFASRISYSNIAVGNGLLGCKNIFKNNSKSSIQNYIDYLNDTKTPITDGSIGIFKDAIIYYGDQFCINLILSYRESEYNYSNANVGGIITNAGIYDSDCNRIDDKGIKQYINIISLQKLINDKYSNTNTNYTLIIIACREFEDNVVLFTNKTSYKSDPNLDISKKNITYKNTLKFYEELIQAVNNYDATKKVINLKSIVNARKVKQIDVIQSQVFSNTKYTNKDRLFPDLTSNKITENTPILYINTDDGNAALITPNQLHNELLSIKSETDIKLFNKFKIKLNKILRLPDESENNGKTIYTYNKQYNPILDIIFKDKPEELKKFKEYVEELKKFKEYVEKYKQQKLLTPIITTKYLNTEDEINTFFSYSYDDNNDNVIDIKKRVELEQTTEIIINNDEITELPDKFNLLENIWKLALMCINLTSIPNSIFTLKSLSSFSIVSNKLTTLPLNFTSLINLNFISLCDCKSLVALPETISNLTKLKTLSLIGCTSLVALPETISNLTKLETLDISGCTSLVALPETISNLTKLESLEISGCISLVALPASINKLTNLNLLDLSGCNKLKELPVDIGNLKKLVNLNISKCTSLVELPTKAIIDNLRKHNRLIIIITK